LSTAEKNVWRPPLFLSLNFEISEKYSISTLHGDMIQKERDQIESSFTSGDINLLVTTDVLSRGYDNKKVWLVIQMDLPVLKSNTSANIYLHRVGRARAPQSICVSFYDSHEDKAILPFLKTWIPAADQPRWMEKALKSSN